LAQILALGDLEDLEGPEHRPLTDQPAPLQHVEVRLQVSVGEVAVTIGELLAAREHQVFVLDREVDQPVDIVLAGRVIARGQLVAVDDRFAIRITQLPAPLKT
jgi:flagellar motor switch protein FliN/FliY